MGWDAAIFGELRFARGKLAQWRKLTTPAEKDEDWPPFIADAVDAADEGAGRRVDDLLRMFAGHATSLEGRQGAIRFVIDGDRLTVRAFAGEDFWRDHGGAAAAALRLAADVGATGTIDFIHAEELEGDRMRLAGGAVTFEPIDHTDAMGDDDSEVAQIMRGLYETPLPDGTTQTKKQKKTKKR